MVTQRSLHHALDRDAIFRALCSFYGITTANGLATTLVCDALILSNDFIIGKVILLDSGASAFETRGATGFNPINGTITVNPAFSAPVLAGTGFYVLTQQSAVAALAAILAAIVALQADVGDASVSTLGSLYAILGNPAQNFNTMIGYEGATSLANKLTAARAILLNNLDAAITSRAAPGDAMDLLATTITAIRQTVCAGGDPAGSIGKLLNDYLNASVLAVKTQTDKLSNFEHEVEWTSTPVAEQVAAAAPTNLTAGSITPTFPAGSTPVRVILVASIHAANQGANTHHIGFKIQSNKTPPGAGYVDRLDLTVIAPLALVNLDGSGDGWCGAIDVTAVVDTSAVVYDFRFEVTSDNAGVINYTTGFALVLIYRI